MRSIELRFGDGKPILTTGFAFEILLNVTFDTPYNKNNVILIILIITGRREGGGEVVKIQAMPAKAINK